MSDDLQRKKQSLQQDLDQLMADTKDLLSSTANVSNHAAKSARAQVEASLQAVKEQVGSDFSAAQDMAKEQLHVLDEQVRANPYKTMGISLGVGVILGFLIGRK
ncbi:MAG: DUF883 family protein [Hydrogenovibrio sp.]|uniref:DUF883 family protein n=1 Tax=Hydrogenovibrio sp. TaxID=2065821 RepID=UPI00287016E2|nr:DUF883 family protein [Hydrogenovibrio sp.]MDR9497749.1 DUF883 family protein [Hydrogenovibrio sp.]